MAPLYMKPRPSVTTPEGMPSVWVSETQVPCSSTAQTCVVSALSLPPLRRGTCVFSPDLMRSASRAA